VRRVEELILLEADHRPPFGVRKVAGDADEREGGDAEDRGADVEGALDDERREGVGQDPAEQDAAEKAVVANAKQIANTFAPFYGEAQAEKLFTLLTGHYAAVKEYSKAIIAGNKGQVNAALAQFESNTDGIDLFFSGVNPNYLPKGTVRPLIAVHVSHHILRINLYHKKEYAKLDATWPMMRQHVYLIADTLTRALAKQFPDKFS